MEIIVTQEQILEHLEKYSQTRGMLRAFCKKYNLPYWKVWKFTKREIKNLSMAAGSEIAFAITDFNGFLLEQVESKVENS